MTKTSDNLKSSINDSTAKFFLIIAMISAIAFLSTWVTGYIVGPSDNWPLRYRFLGAVFASGIGCTFLWSRHVASQQRDAQRYFSALSSADLVKLAQGALGSELPALNTNNPWYTAAQRFTTAFRQHCEELEQVEHARTTLEVRIRRNAARQAQIETILATLPEAVIAIDACDQLILANPAAEQLLGIDLLTTENRSVADIIHDEKLLEELADARRHKVPTARSLELELTDTQNCRKWYGVTTRAFGSREQKGDAPSSLGVFMVLRDISLLKESQKLNAEFVSAVSHEMKTPLAGIKAYVELLVDGDADDEDTREEFLNVINSQANRLQRLIDNLLNLARIEAGVVRVSKEPTSLNELLLEALNIVRPAAESKQISLTTDLSQLYLGVLIDRDMIMQAAINLLSNAVKYTPNQGRIVLRSRLADLKVIFEVEDSGVGLADEDKSRIFEKFYRVKKDREMAAGTGLGLPLTKHIVEDVHGGELIIESELGQGSIFSILLPAATQQATYA